jgi:hypothetical protein
VKKCLLCLLLLLTVGACTTPPRKAVSQASADYRANIAAPAGMARIYILPTLSKGLYTDLEGRAGIGIFKDGSEKGAPLGWTDQSTFVAFDIPAGTYDLMAYTNLSLTRFTKSMTFAPGNVYFYRPTFFRSAKDLSKNGSGMDSVNNGMTFEAVAPAAGRADIQRMDMAVLRKEGQNFLNQAGVTQYQAVQPPPVSHENDFSTVEQKLGDLQKFYQKGLITKEEYDAKRQTILNTY